MESLLISLVTMAAVILIVNKRAGSPRDRDVVSLDAAESGFSITSESKEHKSCVKATGAIPVILIAILLFLFAAVRYRAIFASGSVSRQPVGDGLIGIYGAIPLPQSLWLAQNLSGDTEILFRQGLAQLYNFNQIEARRNFAAALESDGKCWMCVWGIAHSHGSTVNAPMSEQSCNLGRLSIERISAHDQELAALPRLLLKAQQRRYSCCAQSGNWTRQGGVMACEQAYATAMADIIDAFPNNADMLCQYADSLLNLIPWDYYKVIGSLRALVPVAQQAHNAVAKGLEIDPLNLLCLHLAIHIYEPSSSPEHGEVVADTLASLTVASKLGHLIHMPSHIYDRIGRYEDSINCNKLAIKCNEAYISIGLVPYVPEHNKAMLVASALNSGSLGISLRYSRSCQESDPRSGLTLTSSFAAQKELVFSRFGKWAELTALSKTNSHVPFDDMPLYLRAISNYAGSLAALHTGDTRNALLLQEELKLNAVNISNEVYQYRQGHAFYHNHYEMTQIMSIIVQSVVLVREKNFDAAILNLKIAVGIQDRFQYTEPEHFYLPVRHCLGAVYLGAHKSKRNLTLALTQRYLQNAENEYRKDLKQHPRNPWSVKGMYLVLDSYENKTKLLGFKKEYQSILSSRSYAATVAGFGGSCCELGFC